MDTVWIVLVAALSGSLTGGYAGYAITSTRTRAILAGLRDHSHPTAAPPVDQPEPEPTGDGHLDRDDDLFVSQRDAALAGLELLRDIVAVLDGVGHEHKHYSDSEGRCPVGLSPEHSSRLAAIHDDMSRYSLCYGPLLPVPSYEAVNTVDDLLRRVRHPQLTPPAPATASRRNGTGRDPRLLCAYHHAAVDTARATESAVGELRTSLYAAAPTTDAVLS